MKRGGLLYNTFIATVFSNGIIALLDIIVGCFFVFKTSIILLLAPLAPTPFGPLIEWCVTILSNHADMGAFYFFSHGIVKLFLVWGLWRGKLWAYPISIAFLTGFTTYQAFTLSQTYSTFVFVLMGINTIVIAVIASEYRTVRRLRSSGHLSTR